MTKKLASLFIIAAAFISCIQPTPIHCMTNKDRVALSIALIAGGLGLKSIAQGDRSTSTYRTGALMNFFGLMDLMFGSDNLISNSDYVLRCFAFAYYYTETPQEKPTPQTVETENDIVITIHQQ